VPGVPIPQLARGALGVAVALLGSASPQIVSLSPSVAAGSALAVTIEGTGLDAPSSVAEVYGPDGRLVASGSVLQRSRTRLSATLPLAGASPGRYTVKVMGRDGVASNAAVLTLQAEVKVTPASGRPGTPFTYGGRGFTGRSGVTSHLQGPDGLEWQAKRIGTSPEGTFEQVISSGEFRPGTYRVWAMDDRTKATSAPFAFEVVVPSVP
jgi:hypothetical protein